MPSTISQMRNGQIPQQQAQAQTPQLNEEYIQQLKTLMHSGNPSQFLAQATAQNPQLKSIMSMIANGGDPKTIFENLARQRGIDPNLILDKLMS